MLTDYDLRNQQLDSTDLAKLIPRNAVSSAEAIESVRQLVEDVRLSGALALKQQAEKFDQVLIEEFRVPKQRITEALNNLDPVLREALEESISRVTAASKAQLPQAAETSFNHGARVIQRWLPINRVGLYIPGGKAVYPSSVIMNVVPALVAGVKEIVIVSPAQKDYEASVHPLILAAAALLGVEEIYAVGGAGAIAALAYGVPELGLKPVDLITGPGNTYVALAKRLVQNVVAIDSEAGPTEILVIADKTANPAFVAADLISQAEHDEEAAAVLVTDSEELVSAVKKEIDLQLPLIENELRARTALSGKQSAVVLTKDLDQAIDFSNAYAAEHLSVQTYNPEQLLSKIDSAGAVFLGGFSPVSLGDYSAGSNHVLPTGTRAKTASGLSATTFLRGQQIVDYPEAALAELASGIEALATAERLSAHAAAIEIRFREES